MNEQLQGALAQLIEKAISGIDASVDFMQAELPDVISQLLIWYGVSNFIYFIVGLAIVLSWPFAERYAYKRVDEASYWLFLSLPRVFAVFLLFGMLNLEWLQVWIAPKVWLIEYAATLAK